MTLSTSSLNRFMRAGACLGAAIALTGASTAATAQDYGQQPPPPPADGPPPGYGQSSGYDPNAAPPPPPPPPSGYSDQDRSQDQDPRAMQQDQAYANAQEQWATANCIRQAQDRAVAGTVIGGILGAVIGSNLGRGGGRTGGAIIGGAAGAVAGNALARDAGGGMCPQGYVVRAGAPVFAPPPYVVYDAPPAYNPWFWYGGRWVYRPYPYHRYWHDHRY